MDNEQFKIYRDKDKYIRNLIEVLNTHSKTKEIYRRYWVAQWSWTPICDGNSPSETLIDKREVVDGVEIYSSSNNYRKYFGFQLCETKEEAGKVCSIMNSFSYDYESVSGSMLK